MSNTISVTTPPANAIDPRRVGVRPNGSYWGAAGEQIDAMTGNVNYTASLFRAQGRAGTGVSFALNYNSQLWRQDPGGTWKLGEDVGYGFGWKLLAGSLTPVWSGWLALDHYVFVDSTGAEYRLDVPNTPTTGVWAPSSGGLHIWYDSNVGRLYFPDGSFWVFGAVSGGTEQDAGTMYPTIMEDSNGNQIILTYNTGLNATTTNSCARFTQIEDVRANSAGAATWSFTYNTDAIPHLTNISSHLNGEASWTLNYSTSVTLNSPFTPVVNYAPTTTLSSINRDSDGLAAYAFVYDTTTGSQEVNQLTTMRGGSLQWA